MTFLDRLQQLNFQLPAVSTPGGDYASVNIRGNVAYVAVQFPIWNEEFRFQGKLGQELTTEDGRRAAALCALNVLAQVHHKVGFDRVEGLNHYDLYYVTDGHWDEAPQVADAASKLFKEVLVDKGKHSRAILGAAHLPRNFCVGLTASFTLLPTRAVINSGATN